jgi:diphosphoinositol-polyphosphate diphosphatase
MPIATTYLIYLAIIFPLYSSLYSAICFLNQHLLGFYDFKSKTHQDACCPEGMCRAAVFALHVKEELTSWPEQSTRQRTWLTVPEAASQCRYQWMQGPCSQASLTGTTSGAEVAVVQTVTRPNHWIHQGSSNLFIFSLSLGADHAECNNTVYLMLGRSLTLDVTCQDGYLV